ncbi:ankyrin repeat domain-containing protein SOWAHB [Brienomyrus brachyistius]|uniref:ankyrin repeat domain-containing protein SOWAHB n=1 Tax=Brienomyrus brachyistius TaxID=42636 RepID=UPI0020B3FF22|nr:ankyrin repeat domain-containing protein SOWAHB [Brienomyrus brachyistius]
MEGVTEESLLDFIFSAGGKVKNSDLLKRYKEFINHKDKDIRAKYREEFKTVIDKIAVVKSESGEKILVLKKKYKQMMEQEAEWTSSGQGLRGSPGRPSSPGGDEASGANVHGQNLGVPGMAAVKGAGIVSPCGESWCAGPTITITEAPDSQPVDEEQHIEETPSLPGPSQSLSPQAEDSRTLVHREDELNRECGSKSESDLEQDEEGTGSVGSAAVALDPLEKEWMYSAACGQLTHLTELLLQDPTLASKKDFTSFTALHWAAKHGIKEMAAMMANSGADVNTKAIPINFSYFCNLIHFVCLPLSRSYFFFCCRSDGLFGVYQGGYTPLHIAALHGHHHIMDLLVTSYGAKENLRDYSGRLAYHYLNPREPREDDNEPELQLAPSGERKTRRLVTLFHNKKKWGSAEDLPTVIEERSSPHQLVLPPFRPRKFSR